MTKKFSVKEVMDVTVYSKEDNAILYTDKASMAFTAKIPKAYRIDFSNVNTIKDIRKVLKMLDVTVYDNYDNFDDIKHLLIEK